MIVGERAYIFPAADFQKLMAKACKGVVRVRERMSANSVCTGWMLTDKIVVVPAYAFRVSHTDRPERSFTIERRVFPAWREEVTAEAEVLSLGSGVSDFDVALLRLGSSHDNALDLALTPPGIGDYIFVLHFPQGRAAVSLSIGRLLYSDESMVDYDADTLSGSGGGAVFDQHWRVVAVHFQNVVNGRRNRGLNRAMLVQMLQRSRLWNEVAAFHNLADVSAGTRSLADVASAGAEVATTSAVDDALVTAALSSSLNPKTLPDDVRNALRNKVVDPSDRRWTLKTSVRKAALNSVGSLDLLKDRLPRRTKRDAAQKAIDRIVHGPPYDLTREDEESLSWWIQGTRWFSDIAPSLPTAAQVTRELERRRVRSRLEALAGSSFRGRTDELKRFREWFARSPSGPIVVSGIGGVGKSALVAKFASELPPTTVIIWLDFDRADLAPDDARSIAIAIAEQARVQVDGFDLDLASETDGNVAATKLSQTLRTGLGQAAFLMVLDSFEVAQYAERYQELWPVLEAIAGQISLLKIIVSGRAPVEKLAILGRDAESLHLGGMKPREVRAWLRNNGIKGPKVVDSIVSIAHGIPLIVRLALQLVQAGERINRLPKRLPREVIPGYLYRRILRRVRQPELREVAKAALILRRLTADMVQPVLAGVVKLPDTEISQWFPELGREASLVSGTGVLALRPEIRSASIRLLEQEDPKLVQTIETRAERWYEQQDTNQPEIAAELVYLRLRRGSIKEAENAWRDGCANFLQYASDDLRPRARRWLQARLGGKGAGEKFTTRAGELAMADQIRDLRARGLERGVSSILQGRAPTPDSPLLFHHAYELRASGQRDSAIKLLENASSGSESEVRDRTVLLALLLAESDDREGAAKLLTSVEDPERWKDRAAGQLEALAIAAARIRLATDLDAEIQAIHSPTFDFPALLRPIDIILPKLAAKISPTRPEYSVRVQIPFSQSDLQGFASRVAEIRGIEAIDQSVVSVAAPDQMLADHLTRLAEQRWQCVTQNTFLADVDRRLHDRSLTSSALFPAIFGSFALFAGNMGGVSFIGDVLGVAIMPWLKATLPADWGEQQSGILREGIGEETLPLLREAQFSVSRTRAFAVACYVLSPDPLHILTDLIAGTMLATA
jgi:hypothetical protein